MNKGDYLSELHKYLKDMPVEERDNAMRFYMEYFDDAGAENEEGVMQQLGTPKQLAEQIMGDAGEPTKLDEVIEQVREKKKRMSGWNWALVILASPLLIALAGVAFGLLAAVAGVMFAFLVVVLSVVIVPALICVALIPAGIWMAFMGSTLLFSQFATALVFMGMGAAFAALGALFIGPSIGLLRNASRWVFKVSGYMVQKLRLRRPKGGKIA